MTRQTLTQRRILELWATNPGSRTKHRQAELARLVLRDLQAAARRNRRARAAKGAAHGCGASEPAVGPGCGGGDPVGDGRNYLMEANNG